MSINYSIHKFFCINCGRETLPLARKNAHQHEHHHRKKMWCPWCKQEINCIECKNDEDVEEFYIHFKNGDYINEAAESILVSRSTSFWEKFMG